MVARKTSIQPKAVPDKTTEVVDFMGAKSNTHLFTMLCEEMDMNAGISVPTQNSLGFHITEFGSTCLGIQNQWCNKPS